MEYFIMAYGQDCEPMTEIFCDSYMNLEFYAMFTCWPNVHYQRMGACLHVYLLLKHFQGGKCHSFNGSSKKCLILG